MEKKFFPFERMPFLCLALSVAVREPERLRESDAWSEKEEEGGEGREGEGREGGGGGGEKLNQSCSSCLYLYLLVPKPIYM